MSPYLWTSSPCFEQLSLMILFFGLITSSTKDLPKTTICHYSWVNYLFYINGYLYISQQFSKTGCGVHASWYPWAGHFRFCKTSCNVFPHSGGHKCGMTFGLTSGPVTPVLEQSPSRAGLSASWCHPRLPSWPWWHITLFFLYWNYLNMKATTSYWLSCGGLYHVRAFQLWKPLQTF